MSDHQGQLSGFNPEEAPLNQSSSAADFLPNTAQYFAAWLKDVRPSLELEKNHTEPTRLTVAGEPAPGECRFERRFEGRFEGTLRVDGYVTGLLHSLTGTLIIGESGEAECDLNAATVIVEGCVRGNIHATERVVLGSHARMFGNIKCAAVAIAPGAIFEGECHFLPSPFKANSEGNGRASSGNPTFSSPTLPGPNEEETELMAVASGR